MSRLTSSDPLSGLSAVERAQALQSERRWQRAHQIADDHPGVDVGDVYHALRCLELEPAERLRRGLSRGRLRAYAEESVGRMSLVAEIKRLHSPDVVDLTTYQPEEPDNFGFLLQVMVGPLGQDGEESFDILVCTARWIGSRLGPTGILIGRHHLIVDRYDYHRLDAFLREHVAQCSGGSWGEIARKIDRLGKWEFEDYSP